MGTLDDTMGKINQLLFSTVICILLDIWDSFGCYIHSLPR